MPNTAIEALTNLSEVLDAASVAVDDAADALAIAGVNGGSPSPDVNPDATKAGVFGIESSDPKVIEATLRIAATVNQQVYIDYVDGFAQRTYNRGILPQEFTSEGLSVVATDDYRDGDTRRFRLDRIERVAC